MGDTRGPRGSRGSSSSPPPSSSSSSLPLESFVAPGGRGHGLRATRHLGPGASLLRVAPLAAVPYAAHLDRVCGGCLQPCDATRRCARCGVARTCATCAEGTRARRLHDLECDALRRLAREDDAEGLTLAHVDLRLLLRARAALRLAEEAEAEEAAASSSQGGGGVGGGVGGRVGAVADASVAAMCAAGDVVVDGAAAFAELMSGLRGGDDGALAPDAVEKIVEVAKQCKYLVAAELRASLDEYCATLGRLQLNGFEITAAEPTSDGPSSTGANANETPGEGFGFARLVPRGGGGVGGHEPVGVGVYPSAAGFNHSCEPNAAQRFDRHACVVVETTREVRRGEELTIPYVDERLDAAARNERLWKNFAFECDCARCARERRDEAAGNQPTDECA